jgi:aminoglycoside phosphotransferase (APT) family kinase protein
MPLPEKLSPRWRQAFDWVEATLGGPVVHAKRQPRWRPAWFLDVLRDGETIPLYWRGDRGGQAGINRVYTLEHEATVLRVLEAHDVPVPHVHGICPEPLGMLLERVPGRPNLSTAGSEAEREAVQDHFVELLTRAHAIDPAAFEAEGLVRPASAQELALDDLPVWESNYRKLKSRPEPVIEWVLGWLRRNAPPGRERVTFVTGDAGQFVFDAGRVTALLDLELSHLGDPLADLGALRARDLTEPLGDLRRAYLRYEELTGESLDRAALGYHTARFAILTPMAVCHLVSSPPPGLDLIQYLAWEALFARAALDAIAEILGEAPVPPALPDPAATSRSGAHEALVGMLDRPSEDDDFAAYQSDTAARLARYLRDVELLAPALDADELDDVAGVIGERPASLLEADTALERFVQDAPAERDPEILRLLHRRTLRRLALLRSAMREDPDATIQRLS